MELRGLEPLTSWLPATRSSQLSYSPGEIEVVSKVNACVLSVARGRKPETDRIAAGERRAGQEKAALELPAVHREQIDLTVVVRSANVTAGRAARCVEQNGDGVPRGAQPAPLHLDSHELAADLQQEVGTSVLAHRPPDRHAQTCSGQHDRLLRDGAFDVRIHHERMFARASDGKDCCA